MRILPILLFVICFIAILTIVITKTRFRFLIVIAICSIGVIGFFLSSFLFSNQIAPPQDSNLIRLATFNSNKGTTVYGIVVGNNRYISFCWAIQNGTSLVDIINGKKTILTVGIQQGCNTQSGFLGPQKIILQGSGHFVASLDEKGPIKNIGYNSNTNNYPPGFVLTNYGKQAEQDYNTQQSAQNNILLTTQTQNLIFTEINQLVAQEKLLGIDLNTLNANYSNLVTAVNNNQNYIKQETALETSQPSNAKTYQSLVCTAITQQKNNISNFVSNTSTFTADEQRAQSEEQQITININVLNKEVGQAKDSAQTNQALSQGVAVVSQAQANSKSLVANEQNLLAQVQNLSNSLNNSC